MAQLVEVQTSKPGQLTCRLEGVSVEAFGSNFRSYVSLLCPGTFPGHRPASRSWRFGWERTCKPRRPDPDRAEPVLHSSAEERPDFNPLPRLDLACDDDRQPHAAGGVRRDHVVSRGAVSAPRTTATIRRTVIASRRSAIGLHSRTIRGSTQ